MQLCDPEIAIRDFVINSFSCHRRLVHGIDKQLAPGNQLYIIPILFIYTGFLP